MIWLDSCEWARRVEAGEAARSPRNSRSSMCCLFGSGAFAPGGEHLHEAGDRGESRVVVSARGRNKRPRR